MDSEGIVTDEEQSTSDIVISILAISAIVLSIGLWAIQLLAICYAKWHFHSFKPTKPHRPHGVTILKPLKFSPNSCGDLRALRANLESFFQIEYPSFEILFCVREREDASVEIVQKLIREYPTVNAQLLFGGTDFGINPKINNMQKGYEASNPNFELIWICDAGIRVRKDTLSEMASKISQSENIALVHQLPFVETVGNKSAGSLLEKIYFGSQHGRIQISAHCFGQVCITGMSNLIRKKALEDACDGLKGLSNYIAEDYFMTVKMASAGYQFRMSSYPALQNQTNTSICGFFSRMLRWSKLRIKMLPGVTFIEPFTECFLSGTLCALAVSWFYPTFPCQILFAVYVLGWLCGDYVLVRTLQNDKCRIPIYGFIPMWLLRETSTIFILLAALLNPKIKWQHGTFRIKFGGQAEEVEEPNREETHSIS